MTPAQRYAAAVKAADAEIIRLQRIEPEEQPLGFYSAGEMAGLVDRDGWCLLTFHKDAKTISLMPDTAAKLGAWLRATFEEPAP